MAKTDGWTSRARPQAFIERLWRSLQYEKLRLWSYETVVDVTKHVDEWMSFYKHGRTHQHLDYEPPWSHHRPKSESIAA